MGGRFSVQFVGLYKLRYREEDRSATAQVEPLKGKVNWTIYLDTIVSWDPPFQEMILTPAQLQQIRANLVSALDSMGVRYVASGIPGTK